MKNKSDTGGDLTKMMSALYLHKLPRDANNRAQESIKKKKNAFLS